MSTQKAVEAGEGWRGLTSRVVGSLFEPLKNAMVRRTTHPKNMHKAKKKKKIQIFTKHVNELKYNIYLLAGISKSYKCFSCFYLKKKKMLKGKMFRTFMWL